MIFRRITKNDAETLRPFFGKLKSRTCDLTSGCMLMWRDFYSQEFAVEDDVLYVAYFDEDGEKYYALPMGENDNAIEKGIERICDYEEEKGGKALFCAVPKVYLSLFEKSHRYFRILPQVDFFDYLYNAEDLKTLKGKKYNGQRNHISKFKRTASQWSFEEITPQNIGHTVDFLKNTYKKSSDNTNDSDIRNSGEENEMVYEVLENYQIYGLKGGILYADGTPVGFSIGETLGDTLYVHIEKADRNYPGAYQMLVNQFALKYATEGIEYINREDDMGDEGLKRSKLAYHPIELLEKFTLETVDTPEV